MAWPFSHVGAPNLNTGPGIVVPTSPTVISAAQAWILGAHFSNPTAAPITITVTDGAGAMFWEAEIPAGGEQKYDESFRPALGLKWVASSTGLTGHLWGYT